MSALKRLHLSAGVCALIFAGPASAASQSFSVPIQAVTLASGATIGTSLNLPATGSPSFFINFVLPRDYAKDSPITVVLYLSSASACTTRIVAPQLVRRRIGKLAANELAGLDDGSPTIAIPSGIVASKVVTIAPGDILAGQRPGDAVLLQFRREADDAGDTCDGAVFIQAIDIRYPI
jgi:hypothetical protein